MKQYQPLYLKYRPQKLSELVGQEVVTKTLTNAISYNKIVHAYLFCGPRGTGKTSTARILAKSLNCEDGTTLEPCGKCTSCTSITNGNSLDVIEIDAASHRKVEDAEDLINRVSLGTYGSRFKIYIIDEVHMLTDHAFNALLKTLEEPPKNVIFILATTEEYKVIPTIISRCQKLDFKLVSTNELEQKIQAIAKQEKINIDQTIIQFISKRSNGCLRDAVSLLDQISVLQNNDEKINPREVFELFGIIDRQSVFKLLEALLRFDRKNCIDLAEDLVKSGKDLGELFKSTLELIIDLAKAKIDSNFKKNLSIELNNELTILDKVHKNHLLKIIDGLQDAQTKLRFALSQELQFMVEIMGLLDEDFLVSTTELKERIEKLEGDRTQKLKSLETTTCHPEQSEGSTDFSTLIANAPQDQIKSFILQDIHSKNIAGEIQEESKPDLDVLWNKILTLIESNPTRTLLTQSGGYLITLTNEILEIGLSKDIFLPRLEKDIKKKEMILKATKLACGFEPKIIRFKIVLKEKGHESLMIQSELPNSESLFANYKPQTTNNQSNINEEDDEFSRTVKNLLGAKEIE